MAIKKRMRDGTIKYVTYKHEEEDNEKGVKSTPLIEEDHTTKKDLEIRRLEAVIEILTKELEKQSKPKEEAPSSDVMAIHPCSSYDCYC